MRLHSSSGALRLSWVAGASIYLASAALPARAAPCADLNPIRPIYGAGGSAVTATLKNVAKALIALPEAERVTIFFYDPGACAGYGIWRTPDALVENNFKYWDAAGNEFTCQAPQTVVEFAHMGNTPALCPGDVPLPDDAGLFVAPVQSINFITHFDSQYNEISAEALYHIYGFGPGATGHAVAPWIVPNATFGRTTSSFVHQIIAASIGVPATGFKIPAASPNNFLTTNPITVDAVYNWGEASATAVNEPLGYVSGSAATAGEDALKVKTLAYQHFDQSCAYLPDSTRADRDKANVRSGQYWLWTPAWFYTRTEAGGNPTSDLVADLIGWFDGTVDAPGGIDVQEIVVNSGDIPLCAMHAIRPNGDLSAIQSFVPAKPCNGWFDFIATGQTDLTACTQTSECTGEEECRYGYCEAY